MVSGYTLTTFPNTILTTATTTATTKSKDRSNSKQQTKSSPYPMRNRDYSKRLPQLAKNFGVTEAELTGLLINIDGFIQLLCNRYFEVLVDHKAIKYIIKSKTESPTTRLKTLLLKLSDYTIDLKYQKGSEMHTSDTLSGLQTIVDMPDNKDVIP